MFIEIAHARQVKFRYESELLRKANVVSVGIGTHRRHPHRIAIIVGVTHKVPVESLAPEDVIPDELEGITVHVEDYGAFYASAMKARTNEEEQ